MNLCGIFVLFFFVAVSDGKIVFRNDYKYYSSVDGWLKFHQMPDSWEMARLRCFFEGSVLVSPLNKKLLAVMKRNTGQNVQAVFTGISTTHSQGDFYSIEGVHLDSIKKTWAPGQPNHDDGKCVAIGMASDGSFSAVSCHSLLPYMCYKKNQNVPAVSSCGTVDPDYVFEARTGSCYKFHRFGQAWSRAFMACSAEGGHLAVVNSDDEAKVLREIMLKNPSGVVQAKHRDYIALGYRDWSQHGVFMTVHGQTLKEAGYDRWSGGQPDNATTGEYCGSMFRNGYLNDIWCEDAIPFICEKAPRSLQDYGATETADDDNDDDDNSGIKVRDPANVQGS